MATYTIQPGDNLSKIATANKTDVNTLATTNNIANPNLIIAGKTLNIPDAPSSITADSLKTASPIKLPEPTPTVDESGSMMAGATTNIADIIKQLTPTEQTASEKSQQNLLDKMATLAGDEASKSADQLTSENAAGLPDLRKQFADLNGQILTGNAEYDAISKKYDTLASSLEGQGRGLTTGMVTGQQGAVRKQQAAVLNEKASAVGLISARAQALKGQIETAQNTVNRSIDLKYSTIESKINTYEAQLNALMPTLNKEEKTRALAQQTLLEQEKQKVLDAKKAEQDKSNTIIDLITKYPDAGIGFSDSLESAQAKLSKSKIYQDQVRAPASGGGGGGSGVLGLTNQQIDNVSPLVTQFQNSPIVQNYNTIGEGYNFANSLSNKSTNPADDQALIYALAKALDPGSVVREGEYATAQKYAQSLVQSYGKSVTQALAGSGFLSEDARKNIKNTISSRFRAAEVSYNNLKNETERRVNLVGSTDKGGQLLNNYGGAFTPENAPKPIEAVVATPPAQQGFWSGLGAWLYGE